jgi:prephenate dehydrogenase
MWRDIAMMNRESVLELMDFFAEYFAELRRLVENGDPRELEDFFARSKERRDAIQ